MLNCLVNSIFHILFCIALAKVLKSSAGGALSPVFVICAYLFSSPFFFIHHLIHHEKIFLAGNSDSAMICEAFRFIAFSQLGLRCWLLFLTAIATLYRHSCKKCWIPPQFIQILCNLEVCLNLCARQR